MSIPILVGNVCRLNLGICLCSMCYLFCRCTRSVSVCPPAYYAHLAAFRGRAMLHATDTTASETSGSAQSMQVHPCPAGMHAYNTDFTFGEHDGKACRSGSWSIGVHAFLPLLCSPASSLNLLSLGSYK